MRRAAPRVLVSGHSRRRPLVGERAAVRVRDGRAERITDPVAAEVPVVLVYNGESHAVMMASPADLEDFALGFSVTEGFVADPAEIEAVTIEDVALGLEVRLTVPDARAARLVERKRAVEGRTGCGLCGILSLEQAVRPLPVMTAAPRIEAGAVTRALAELPAHQTANRASGAAHAAAWCDLDGAVRLVREDVGRHNALDKLVGALARGRIDTARGFTILTSRFSAELVQKCAIAGIAVVAAVSAPTSLAIELADQAGLTLIGFARGSGFTIYSHAERLGNLP